MTDQYEHPSPHHLYCGVRVDPLLDPTDVNIFTGLAGSEGAPAPPADKNIIPNKCHLIGDKTPVISPARQVFR